MLEVLTDLLSWFNAGLVTVSLILSCLLSWERLHRRRRRKRRRLK